MSIAILGSHGVGGPHDEQYWDAFDAVIDTDTGESVLFGVRTAGYLDRVGADAHGVEDWNGYRPLAVTLDRSSVAHWDFSEVLWLGPEPHPCLIWSNAAALTLDAATYLLSLERGGILLSGPNGDGLPRPCDLGVTVAEGLQRQRIDS